VEIEQTISLKLFQKVLIINFSGI